MHMTQTVPPKKKANITSSDHYSCVICQWHLLLRSCRNCLITLLTIQVSAMELPFSDPVSHCGLLNDEFLQRHTQMQASTLILNEASEWTSSGSLSKLPSDGKKLLHCPSENLEKPYIRMKEQKCTHTTYFWFFINVLKPLLDTVWCQNWSLW